MTLALRVASFTVIASLADHRVGDFSFFLRIRSGVSPDRAQGAAGGGGIPGRSIGADTHGRAVLAVQRKHCHSGRCNGIGLGEAGTRRATDGAGQWVSWQIADCAIHKQARRGSLQIEAL